MNDNFFQQKFDKSHHFSAGAPDAEIKDHRKRPKSVEHTKFNKHKNLERYQGFVPQVFKVRDSVSIDDLNLQLKDMTRCVNEIGYRAKVIDTKRFDKTDNSLKNSIRAARDEDKPIDFQLTTSINTSNVNTNRTFSQ